MTTEFTIRYMFQDGGRFYFEDNGAMIFWTPTIKVTDFDLDAAIIARKEFETYIRENGLNYIVR